MSVFPSFVHDGETTVRLRDKISIFSDPMSIIEWLLMLIIFNGSMKQWWMRVCMTEHRDINFITLAHCSVCGVYMRLTDGKLMENLYFDWGRWSSKHGSMTRIIYFNHI